MSTILKKVSKYGSTDLLYNPNGDQESRVRMLEAKVEYLLDELYTAKGQLRRLAARSPEFKPERAFQLETFDFQWKHLPYHDAFLTNAEWRNKAADDVCRRLEVEPPWFQRKRILDCGCGPGRHAWAFATLAAKVTAFDMLENGLADARRECEAFQDMTFERRNILESLPYPRDYDLVWSYGVIHCTGDTYGALCNIAKHVKPGGYIYFMVYPEPWRTNIDSYKYYHEVSAIRGLTRSLSFSDKAEVLKLIQGERWPCHGLTRFPQKSTTYTRSKKRTKCFGH